MYKSSDVYKIRLNSKDSEREVLFHSKITLKDDDRKEEVVVFENKYGYWLCGCRPRADHTCSLNVSQVRKDVIYENKAKYWWGGYKPAKEWVCYLTTDSDAASGKTFNFNLGDNK